MGNGSVLQSHGNHVFLSVFNAFADSFRNFSCLAQACANLALAITDYYDCSKGKTTAAFYDFSNAVDENDVFL